MAVNSVTTQDKWFYLSAYAIAVKHGYEGTEEEWINDLRREVTAAEAARDAAQDAAQDASDAAQLAAAAAGSAETSATGAGDSATAASNAQAAAEDARDMAAQWATGDSAGEPSASNNAQYYAGVAVGAQAAAIAAADAAEAAQVAAEAAQAEIEGHIEDAEAWAVGQRGGVDVDSSDPTYHNNAKYYAGEAADAAESADDAQDAAVSAKDAAVTAKNAAVVAQGAAETAQTAAEAAQLGAEQARDTAVYYGQLSTTAATDATAAKTAAESAQTAAETAQGKAEDAQTAAEGAATAADNAKTDAVNAKTAAQASQTAAAGSATLAESWAKGGTETRTGEDTNNAKYYADQAADLVGEIKSAIDTKAPVIIDTVSGAVASFSDGADGMPVKSLVVNIDPVQSGSGDPSPDNVRPISGWTEARTARTGKNLWGFGNQSFTRYTNCNFQGKGLPAGTYTFSGLISSTDTDSTVCAVYFKDADGTDIAYITLGRSTTVRQSATVVLTARCKTIRLYASNTNAHSTDDTATYENVQLEVGSVATEYASYQATVNTPSWQTEGGTVYGGTLDVTTGLLTVTMAEYTFTGNEYAVSSSVGRVYFLISDITNLIKAPTSRGVAANMISEKFRTIDDDHLERNSGQMSFYNGQLGVCVIKTSDAGDTSLAKQTVAGMKLVFELATPITYQLTAQQVTTLLGTNNIWADTGDSTVEYPADTKLYIDKKLAALVAALS